MTSDLATAYRYIDTMARHARSAAEQVVGDGGEVAFMLLVSGPESCTLLHAGSDDSDPNTLKVLTDLVNAANQIAGEGDEQAEALYRLMPLFPELPDPP